MKKKWRNIKVAIIFLVVGVISNLLVRNSSVASFDIFSTLALFTYFGVLIGFSITIYTFGLSMVSDIKDKLYQSKKFSPDRKLELNNILERGFHEIKGDIWLIFVSIIIVICTAIFKEIDLFKCFIFSQYQIPETLNITFFITSTIAMWDILKSMFNLSEIHLLMNSLDKEKSLDNFPS